jgi:phosphohistidine phosphatase
MTRTLILTRHAKSSWDNPNLDDHDRPLNKRGVRSAHALAGWFREVDLTPDQVLSSSSKRTGETFTGLELETPPEFTRSLYHAPASQMFEVLSHATGNMVLMLGHNPGIADFAARLTNEHPDHPRFIDYPSGATLVLSFEIDDWSLLRWSSGSVVDFVVPRDLLDK